MKRQRLCFFIFFLILLALSMHVMAEENISFVVVSDLHLSEKEGIKHFSSLIKQMNELEPKPEFVVVTGDIHAKEFENVFDELKPEIPFHIVFGNHEKREDRKIFMHMFPQDFKQNDFYSFVHRNAKFIILCDASDTGDHIGHFESEGIKGQEQQNWLEQELNVDRQQYPFIFIFAHIPPNHEGKAGNMYLSSNDQKALSEILKKYKPNAMFCGHLHKREKYIIGETPVFILPSLNWNFEDFSPEFYYVRTEGETFHVDNIKLNIPEEK
ncbi:MAG TPA: metallophosphoesterase [Candidatus Hydrogenedens sp.]|nr:metallophosphoesterase [Candidatus Hydrogenedens sp.]HOL20833.1 metallophosphoesterase [Candidatus Hydrogenedens sp.]HPP59999.1 metallophosphoesterase [Candidatus Hydrogenedens sp.]